MAAPKNTTLPRSDAGIDKLPVPDRQPAEYGDGSGLRLRINPAGLSGRGGAKVWRWFPRLDGKRLNVTLGSWSKTGAGGLNLSMARQRLDALKQAHLTGTLATELRPTLPAAGPLLMKDLAEDFRTYIGKRRKNPYEVNATLDKVVLPVLGERPVRSITSPDIRKLVEATVARGAASQAGKVLAHVRQLFRFAQGRGDVEINPATPLDPAMLGVEKNACDRFLTQDEIVAFWRALDQSCLTPTVRVLLRLLLLLGVRTGELLQATWDEVDFAAATWTVPVAHQKLTMRQAKRARPWIVPLPPLAVSLFKELHSFAKSLSSNSVAASFAADGGAALSGKALVQGMRRLFEGAEPILVFSGERPTPHDLRRTLRTHLGETLDVDFGVAERCLNHQLGGVAAIYAKGDYLDARRAALEKWAAYVERLLEGKTAPVAFLPVKKARQA